MNRYPTWGYVMIAIAILIAALYTVPNFYGESPAVQVSSAKTTVKIDNALYGRVEQTLKDAKVPYERMQMDLVGVKVRFADTDSQIKARDALNAALNTERDNPSYAIALNLLPASP